ncbi:MAG TPA: hypothetical protein VH595_06865 [Verrucomicrobiae bacterium]|jgi:hypothetical protein|nr:hypothetical protein [Verrucomicrobiae bacterium]
MNILHLGTGSKSRQYQAVQGASSIPTVTVWLNQTKDKGGRDPLMMDIDECLRLYASARDGWDRLALLGRLYFATNYYLKRAPGVAPKPQRETAVNQLFLTVVDMLCKSFNCAVNFLPKMLEETWGSILTKHGYDVDTQQVKPGAPSKVAEYLDRASALKFKLHFNGGKAFMRDRAKFTYWVPANSAAIGWTCPAGDIDPMMKKGYAGFALSMDREFFMAHHRGGFLDGNFFHSSYLAGNTVLCAGTMLIEYGLVKGIANDSGHYQPTHDHLLNVVQTLKMHGCDMNIITVWSVPCSWKDDSGVLQLGWGACSALEMLRKRGTGYGLFKRMDANQAQIAKRTKGAQGANPVVTLPPRVPPPAPPPRRPPPLPPRT